MKQVMKKAHWILVAALGFGGGMLAQSDALSASGAEAQYPQTQQQQRPTTRTPTAVPAPSSSYSQCFAVTLYAISGRALNGGGNPRATVNIPAGWTPVGGTQHGDEPAMILCR